jgi:integrase
MITLHKRGPIWHFCTYVNGRRLRGSLGTSDEKIANLRRSQIEYAIQAGPESEVWLPLRLLLPKSTLQTLNRALVGPTPTFDLREVERKYIGYLERQEAMGRLARKTVRVYEAAVSKFFDWLSEQDVRKMDEIRSQTLESYYLFRKAQIANSRWFTNGHGIHIEMSAIKRMVDYCVEENIIKPLKYPDFPKPEGEVESAQPFSQDELNRMEAETKGLVKLAFMLFRWTGMRRSDVAALRWRDIDLSTKRIIKLTQKRKKLVIVPMAPALYQELARWHEILAPEPGDEVLVNFTGEKLYTVMTELGKKCGILEVYPHRFRASFVVHLLEKQVPIFEVAKMIGDDPSTLSRAYAKFTDGMVDRVREILEDFQRER